MTDIYISTPTQADYDALMRLAEAAGYTWGSGKKISATNVNNWSERKEKTVVRLDAFYRYLGYDEVDYYESEGRTIETIPNLPKIKAIWNVKPECLNVFSGEKLNTSDVIKDWALNDGVIILLANGSYDLGFEEVYKALAVEYKPQESEEVMPEKVKLPKFMCTWLTQFDSKFPLSNIAKINEKRLKDSTGHEIYQWLNSNETNQWKLIDALRNGYEAEPEQLYYVWFVKGDLDAFLNVRKFNNGLVTTDKNETLGYKTRFTMPEILAIDPRYKAFAVKVEEVDNDD